MGCHSDHDLLDDDDDNHYQRALVGKIHVVLADIQDEYRVCFQ